MTALVKYLRVGYLAALICTLCLFAVDSFAQNEVIVRDGNGNPGCGGVTDNAAQDLYNFRLGVTTKHLLVESAAGAGSSVVEDAAHVDGEDISAGGCRRIDVLATSTGTSGDWGTCNQDATGAQWVHISTIDAGTNAIGKLAANSGVDIGDVDVTSTVLPVGGGITCGQTDVPGTGTNVNLAANACKTVILCCETANTGDCFVSHATGNGVTGGMAIPDGGQCVTLQVTNTNLLWVDVSTNGDDVGWCCIN